MGSLCCWKQLWRWISCESLTCDDLIALICKPEVLEQIEKGLQYYKPLDKNSFPNFQKTHASDGKLINIIENLQSLINLDSEQSWQLLMHYLSSQAYGTPKSALKNVAFLDTQLIHIIPKIFAFFYSERLYMLKLLKYIIEFSDNECNMYHKEFRKIIDKLSPSKLRKSLLKQFEILLKGAPPTRRENGEIVSIEMQKHWALHNLLEQSEILQLFLLINNNFEPFTVDEFKQFYGLCKFHDLGRKQTYFSILDDKTKQHCMNILYNEVAVFMTAMDSSKIKNVACWIENVQESFESELSKLELLEEHSALMISWMMLSLESERHDKLFESHFQQFGFKALQMKVFKFLHQMISTSFYKEDAECGKIFRLHLFNLLNALCDKFDGDGSISHQPYAIELLGELLKTNENAEEFMSLQSEDSDCGVVSMWNMCLELFPFNFKALSTVSAGLATSEYKIVHKLTVQLANLPAYTEVFDPSKVSIKMSRGCEDVTIMNDYKPFNDRTYTIKAGSSAAITETKEGTLIHYRTPITYWTVLQKYIEKALDTRTHNPAEIMTLLDRIKDGFLVLKEILNVIIPRGKLPNYLVPLNEAVFDIMLRFSRVETPPLDLIVICLEICSLLVTMFPKEIHMRLMNTDLFPRIMNEKLSYVEYANGASFNSFAVGSYLLNFEMPAGSYKFLNAYINMLSAFYEACEHNERIIMDILLPGLMLILREIFPNLCNWRYACPEERRTLTMNCITYVSKVIQLNSKQQNVETLIQKTCVYNLLHMENATELLKIIAVGDEQLERMMENEPNWVTGSGVQYLRNMQRTMGLLMHILRLKYLVNTTDDLSPLEQLIFSQTKEQDMLRLVRKVTGYLNHALNKHIPILACKLLQKFAMEMDMSLFSCMEMSPHQVRVMFLDRLRDEYEAVELKIAILDFVTSCVEKQPAMIEAFFSIQHDDKSKKCKLDAATETARKEQGVLSFMAEYLDKVKTDAHSLHSPLLGCIMGLFHAIWKNNMQILVRDLKENTRFWEYMTSPLFSEIQPELRTYAQIFNLLGIELFTMRDQIEPQLKQQLEVFFDTENPYLDKWINYIYAFEGRNQSREGVDVVPVWLSLLSSWKDFTMICCKCLPIPLNLRHKTKFASPCLKSLLQELENMSDGRLVAVLSEAYVTMLSNWKDDCFDSKKEIVKQVNELLNHAATLYDSLHPRTKRAILSIGTVTINNLDYEIKANNVVAKNMIKTVTVINSLELDRLYTELQESPKEVSIELNRNGFQVKQDVAPIVLALAMLEQCLDVYDDMFSSLMTWFQSTKFVNKIFCCLQKCLNKRQHYYTTLRALRCLTAYARGPFSKDLLNVDVDQFLFMQLLPPKYIADNKSMDPKAWKANEWWTIYGFGLDFMATMVMKHEHFFLNEAITFVGVHLEQLVDAILLPRQYIDMEVLNMCASALGLIKQIVRFEARWRIQNLNSLSAIMRATSVCLYHCVSLVMRSRVIQHLVDHPESGVPMPQDEQQSVTPSQKVVATLNRLLEIIHTASLCLISFSPDLLSLLADPDLDVARWNPIVDMNFGAPKIINDALPQLNFGTLLTAITILTRSLNHSYHGDDLNTSSSRSPRSLSRRRGCSCSSPGVETPSTAARRLSRSESVTSVTSSSGAVAVGWLAAFDKQLVSNALEVLLTLLASQALLAIRDRCTSNRDKQLVRRELASELTNYHDFVRKRIMSVSLSRNPLVRNKLGIWPLATNEDEEKMIAIVKEKYECECESMDEDSPPPQPPPPKRAQDSMREFLLRKQHLNKAKTLNSTPVKKSDGFSAKPLSHSTPAPVEKKNKGKKVSWAETTQESPDGSTEPIDEPIYSNLTDVQINNDEDYLHFMSNVFLFICQADL